MSLRIIALAVISVQLLVAQTLGAEGVLDDDLRFFESEIRPMLVRHCYECHSADSEEIGGKLLLDSREGILQGGESGAAVVPGEPGQSLLIEAVRYNGLEMPPAEQLPAAVIADLVRWVEEGAVSPPSRGTRTATSDRDGHAHWSFSPRVDVPLPDVRDRSWPRDPLDRFVLARIEASEQAPAQDAPPSTLVRRLYYDLIGLPPSAEEIEAFVADHQQAGNAAVKRLVDRLLASPRFGERWGRHWLDVARYAESNGDDGLGRNATFPHAWRFRDYVIEALNRDVTYDQFLKEQIAGDCLPAETAEQRNRQLIATGFLALGSKPAAAMNNNFAMDVVDDQINVVSTAVMGLSVACARCHDHKHDPIPTRDYYALAGIFASTEPLYGAAANEPLTVPPTPLHELNPDWLPGGRIARDTVPTFLDSYPSAIKALHPHTYADLRRQPPQLMIESDVVFSEEEYARVETARIRGQLETETDSYSVAFWFKNETDNLARPITAYLFSRGALDDGQLPGDHLGIGGAHEPSKSGRLFVFNGNETKQSLVGSTVIPRGTWNHLVLIRSGSRIKVLLNGAAEPEIDGELPGTRGGATDYCLGSRSDKFAPLVGRLAEFAVFSRAINDDEARRLFIASGQTPSRPPIGFAMGVREKAEPVNCRIHINGDGGNLGSAVPRGVLALFDQAWEGGEGQLPKFSTPEDASGRLRLVEWLTDVDHPLTARVMVNRIWLHLFGQGIVTTPDDFGVYGSRPVDPNLLDHLAERFARDGWSTKRLIRAIVLSRTYQLDSRCPESLLQDDPDNQLFARHHRRRLDAESLRDSILAASGRLDLRTGTGSDAESIDRLLNWPPGEATDLHRPSNHRSIYLCMLRNAPPRELAAFDLPDAVNVLGRREVTTLPTHGLFLLNNTFVIDQSAVLAERVLSAWADDTQRITALFRAALGRSPSDAEIRSSLQYLETLNDSLAPVSPDVEASPDAREIDRASSELPGMVAWGSLCQALLATNEFRYVD